MLLPGFHHQVEAEQVGDGAEPGEHTFRGGCGWGGAAAEEESPRLVVLPDQCLRFGRPALPGGQVRPPRGQTEGLAVGAPVGVADLAQADGRHAPGQFPDQRGTVELPAAPAVGDRRQAARPDRAGRDRPGVEVGDGVDELRPTSALPAATGAATGRQAGILWTYSSALPWPGV
ncbi:hypothetical protein [Micromonospora echinofusca]|uniref:Uncharacterized protein n=1 Tax=Micromonospora echinofusca TaxID=47858 RepID=A0ABS3VWG2_MICEH|nr:hypothetical protein [Micromonospora echinofusca]MBO4208838.1 hypothetical protein [Micromonospora echinofusca]